MSWEVLGRLSAQMRDRVAAQLGAGFDPNKKEKDIRAQTQRQAIELALRLRNNPYRENFLGSFQGAQTPGSVFQGGPGLAEASIAFGNDLKRLKDIAGALGRKHLAPGERPTESDQAMVGNIELALNPTMNRQAFDAELERFMKENGGFHWRQTPRGAEYSIDGQTWQPWDPQLESSPLADGSPMGLLRRAIRSRQR